MANQSLQRFLATRMLLCSHEGTMSAYWSKHSVPSAVKRLNSFDLVGSYREREQMLRTKLREMQQGLCTICLLNACKVLDQRNGTPRGLLCQSCKTFVNKYEKPNDALFKEGSIPMEMGQYFQSVGLEIHDLKTRIEEYLQNPPAKLFALIYRPYRKQSAKRVTQSDPLRTAEYLCQLRYRSFFFDTNSRTFQSR